MNNKTTLKEWEKVVNESKEILQAKERNQILIAKKAISVCVITHGGDVNKSTYTLTRFAKEIGINSSTLQEWVRVFNNVYTKLDSQFKSTAKYIDLHNIASGIDKNSSNKSINNIAMKYFKYTKNDYRILHYCKNLCSLYQNLKQPIILENIDLQVIQEVLFYLQACETSIKNGQRKIIASNNKLASKTHEVKFNSTKNSNSKLIPGKYKDSEGFDVKISTKDISVYDFIKKSKKYESPTDIASNLTHLPRSSRSAWACRSLNKFLELGLVKKNKEGHYKYIKSRSK